MRRIRSKLEINGIEVTCVRAPERYDSTLVYTYDENGAMAYARFRIDTAAFVVDNLKCRYSQEQIESVENRIDTNKSKLLKIW